MNSTLRKLTLLFGLIALSGSVSAQPKPWTFGESVVISPNLYTGTMQLAIPFYTYKDADFEIPVNFGYSSSGCVANVRGGIMGPGWGLNVGGSITREIRGIPDENKYLSSRNVLGFYYLHKNVTIQETLSVTLSKLFRVFGLPGGTLMSNPDIKDMYPTIIYSIVDIFDNSNVSTLKYDAEPDIFHFNFMGYSGTFHLGFNGEINIYNTNIDSKNFKVEIEHNNNDTPDDNFVLHAFKSINIQTPDGYKYVFDCNLQSPNVIFSISMDEANVSGNSSISGFALRAIHAISKLPDEKGEVTAWTLTKILAPNGRTATFDYEHKKIYNYTPSNFYSSGNYFVNIFKHMFLPFRFQSTNATIPNPINDKEHLFYFNISYIPVLKTITVNDVNNTAVAEIKFNYINQSSLGKEQYRALKTTLQDIDDQSVKLSSITVNSKLNNTTTKVKECNLTYMNNTNGARTSYLKDITIQGDGTYSMAYLNWNNSAYPYPANGTFSVDHWGYYNGRNNNNSTNYPFLNIASCDTDFSEHIMYLDKDHYTNYAKCGMLSQITYPTGGRYTFEYESHDYNKAVKRLSSNSFIPQVINTPGTCGGLRVKTIKNYSNNSESSLLLTKNYVYKNSDDTSSGILLNMPRYGIKYSASLSGTNINDSNMTFRSSDLTEFNNIHIEYAMVRETQNDGSHIRYSFTNSSMQGYMDTVTYISVPEKTYHNGTYKTWSATSHTALRNVVAPVVSKQFMRGRLLLTNVLNSSGTSIFATPPLYTETNTYENTYTNSQTHVPHYFVRALGYMPVYTGKYNMQSTTQTQHVNGVDVSTANSCTYNSHGQVASQTTTDSKGVTQIVEYKYVTDTTTNVNGSRIIDLMAKHNVVNLPLREEVYTVENGVKTRIGGRRYTYFNPISGKPAMIRLLHVEAYDSETGSWIMDAKYNVYDSYGNLLEKEDANGLKTGYIYGYGGLYKIAEISNCSFNQIKSVSGLSNIQTAPLSANMTGTAETALRGIQDAEVTTFDYKPLVGLAKIKDSTGRSVSYIYNRHGKLEKVINTAGEPEIRYNYSTDNN
ncbi:MAG: hypothetical protein LBJ63_04915 [Prevotellaceae bacterium]|jgi:hypothetical protein|nr:hypothetical protein [Prevotellaceae bacterium]